MKFFDQRENLEPLELQLEQGDLTLNVVFLILKRLFLVTEISVTIVRWFLMNLTTSLSWKVFLRRYLLSFIIPVSENDSATLKINTNVMRKIRKFISEVLFDCPAQYFPSFLYIRLTYHKVDER